MKKEKRKKIRNICAGILAGCAAVALIVTSVRYNMAEGEMYIIEDESVAMSATMLYADLSDFSMWRVGTYSVNDGQYSSGATARICLNDYLGCQGETTYSISISDPGYQMLIREINSEQKMVTSGNLKSGQSFVTKSDTVSLGISLYNPSNGRLTFDDYRALFEAGFSVQITYTQNDVVEETVDIAETTDNIENAETTVETQESDSIVEGGTETDTTTESESASVEESAQEDTTDNTTVAFTDIWRSGCYSSNTGQYCESAGRICHVDYDIAYPSAEYVANISNAGYTLLIRELDKNMKMVASYSVTNGKTVTTTSSTAYVGISLYCPTNGKMTFEKYKSLFASGFSAEFVPASDKTDADTSTDQTTESTTEESTQESTSDKNETDKDTSEFEKLWRTGCYSHTTGQYVASTSGRICYTDYVETDGGVTYTANISNSSYRLLIRELDKDYKFIASSNLADQKTFTTNAKTKYLGIGLYCPMNSSLTYEDYKALFANGFDAYLTSSDEEEDEITHSGTDTGLDSNAQAVYDILKNAMLESDGTKFNISKYNLTVDEVENEIWGKVIDDYYLEYIAQNGIRICVIPKNGYAYQCYLLEMDSKYEQRLPKVKETVNKYLAQIDSKMTDLDKVLLAHEFIVDNTEYKVTSGVSYRAAGPLSEGYGVCGGYSSAMIALLHCVDIDAYEVIGQGMNHEWIYVKVDGEYYHVDPTWDDTQKGRNDIYQHRFLIRNDDEFSTIAAARVHSNWYSYQIDDVTCSSNKYTNWYVHDVAGTMHYYNGMWYYNDLNSNSIICANISGSVQKVVYNGSAVSETVKIKGIENGVLSYYVGSNLYTKKL